MDASCAANRLGSRRSSSLSAAPAENWLFSSSMIDSQTGGLLPWHESDSSLTNISSSASKGGAALFKVGWLTGTKWNVAASVRSSSSETLSFLFFLWHSTAMGVVLADPFRRPDFKKWFFLSLVVPFSAKAVIVTAGLFVPTIATGGEIVKEGAVASWDETSYCAVPLNWSFVLLTSIGVCSEKGSSSVRIGILNGAWVGLTELSTAGSDICWFSTKSDKLGSNWGVDVWLITTVDLPFDVFVGGASAMFLGSEIIIGLPFPLPCCCSRPASARNCSVVIVTTLGWPGVDEGFFAIGEILGIGW